MKRWLKYLLPLVVGVAFWNSTDELSSKTSEELSATQAIGETVCDNIISASESELCLPRQISNASSSRVQTTTRRAAGFNRINVEFVKSDRRIHVGFGYFRQRNSQLLHSSLMEPAHKLLYLGKLII